MIPREFLALVSDLASAASGSPDEVTNASHLNGPTAVIERAVACGLADVDGTCVRLTSMAWRVTYALARQQRNNEAAARAARNDDTSELWESQIAARVEAVLTRLCRHASSTRCPITGCDLANSAEMPLDCAPPGVVGHLQSPELNRALGASEREHLPSASAGERRAAAGARRREFEPNTPWVTPRSRARSPGRDGW